MCNVTDTFIPYGPHPDKNTISVNPSWRPPFFGCASHSTIQYSIPLFDPCHAVKKYQIKDSINPFQKAEKEEVASQSRPQARMRRCLPCHVCMYVRDPVREMITPGANMNQVEISQVGEIKGKRGFSAAAAGHLLVAEADGARRGRRRHVPLARGDVVNGA